jgi:hypothetical protein
MSLLRTARPADADSPHDITQESTWTAASR